jgi:EpsI family protein
MGSILMLESKSPAQNVPGGYESDGRLKIPYEIGGWKGLDVEYDDSVKAILETDSIILREYVNGVKKLWLAIVYYENSRFSIHLPESCYSGQGSHIIEKSIEKIMFDTANKPEITHNKSNKVKINKIDNFNVNKLIVTGNKGHRSILYYFETGNVRTHSYMKIRWDMIKSRIRKNKNNGALVRVSALVDDTANKTTEMLKEFTKEIAKIMPDCF